MNHVISPINCIPDNVLDALCLAPRLSFWVVDVGMGTEEWEVHASLVEAYPDLICWHTDEAWDVCTTKDVSTKTVLHDHLDCAKHFLILGEIITSPICTVLLRSKEVGASEYKWPSSALVALIKTPMATHLLRGTIGVVEITVFNLFTVNADVLGRV